MKRAISALLILAIITMGTIGASGTKEQATDQAKQTAGPVELTIWAWDKGFNGYAMELADQLDDDVTVNFVEMGKAAALQKIHTVLASGETKGLPDIVLISDLNAQGYLMSYPGAFLAMDDVINYNDFAPYKKGMLSYDRVGYGIPFDTGVAALFYRVDYMEEIGVTKEMMDNLTWDEYLALGPKLKAKGHYLQPFNPDDVAQSQILLQSAGTWYTDENGAVNFANNAALKEYYRLFKQMNESDYVKVISDWNGLVGSFNSGDVACIMRGSWISSSVMAAADQSGKWAVAPIPKLNVPGAVKASNQGGSSWFILAKAPHAKEAAQFMKKTFAGSIDLYNTMLKEKTILATYMPANNAPAYDEPSEFYGGQRVNKDLATWAAQIPSVDTGAYSAEAQAALSSVTPRILAGGDLNSLLVEAEKNFKSKI